VIGAAAQPEVTSTDRQPVGDQARVKRQAKQRAPGTASRRPADRLRDFNTVPRSAEFSELAESVRVLGTSSAGEPPLHPPLRVAD
jgi:hypothetical protein